MAGAGPGLLCGIAGARRARQPLHMLLVAELFIAERHAVPNVYLGPFPVLRQVPVGTQQQLSLKVRASPLMPTKGPLGYCTVSSPSNSRWGLTSSSQGTDATASGKHCCMVRYTTRVLS